MALVSRLEQALNELEIVDKGTPAYRLAMEMLMKELGGNRHVEERFVPRLHALGINTRRMEVIRPTRDVNNEYTQFTDEVVLDGDIVREAIQEPVEEPVVEKSVAKKKKTTKKKRVAKKDE